MHACNIERERKRERALEVLERRLVFGNMLDVCRVGVKKKTHNILKPKPDMHNTSKPKPLELLTKLTMLCLVVLG